MEDNMFFPAQANQATDRELIQTEEAPSFSGQTYQSHSYYRSHLFSVTHASSPLLQAALPLFNFLLRLQNSQALPPAQTLHEQIQHEIQAFSSQVQNVSYLFETLWLGRYLLCVTFDHYLLRSNAHFAHAWEKWRLVHHLQNPGLHELAEHEVHLQKVNRICQSLLNNNEPQPDLIEFSYYCLRFGFDQQDELNFEENMPGITAGELSDLLYQCLIKLRPIEPQLFQVPQTLLASDLLVPEKFHLPRSLMFSAGGVVAILGSCYLLFSYLFSLFSQPLLGQLQLLG
jgi:type IV/VI secretion system ImpK/VasF family protein